MLNEQILQNFIEVAPRLDQVRSFVESEVERLLERHAVKVHFTGSRLKSIESLQHKLSRPEKTYAHLFEVTDLIGVRIITYFEDEITQVAALIEQHLKVDFQHSKNKLHHRDLGKFGYRSLHYTCAFEEETRRRYELPEELRFEIQIRTVLQHAWAEIEHDLGYKAQDTIPDPIRRRFSRVASLLEIADEEFDSIKRDLSIYERSVKEMRSGADADLPLDRVSLASIADGNTVASLDASIAQLLGREISSDLFYPEYLLKMLRLAGVATTKELLGALTQHEAGVVQLVGPYFDFARSMWNLSANTLTVVYRGYSLFFLAHLLVVRSTSLELNKVARLTAFYHELDYPNDERTAARVASELYQTLMSKIATNIIPA